MTCEQRWLALWIGILILGLSSCSNGGGGGGGGVDPAQGSIWDQMVWDEGTWG